MWVLKLITLLLKVKIPYNSIASKLSIIYNIVQMDESKFNKLPLEWVDRIFMRLESIYGDKWKELLPNEGKKQLYQKIWSTGLSGLKATEIQKALDACRSGDKYYPPTHIEFYHYAKGIKIPTIHEKKKN